MIYFKRFLGDMAGESVTFFNIIASKTTLTVAFRTINFPYNLDLTK